MASQSSATMEPKRHNSDHLTLEKSNSLDANNHNDYDDFPLGEEEEEHKEDYFDTSHYLRQSSQQDDSNNNNAWVQLLNLPPTTNNVQMSAGVPVGGMRRVSSCYFSIASNMSNNPNDYFNTTAESSSFHSPNPSYHNNSSHHHSHHYDALSFEGRNASDFLVHDVLMNVFSFLDAHSLASFSETGRRPNFECFYFLELQLQRALLMGDSHNYFGVCNEMGIDRGTIEKAVVGDVHEDALDDDNVVRVEGEEDDNSSHQASSGEDEDESVESDPAGKHDRKSIPSFDGAIAGTGVISRLASLNSASARKIVQTYLDSNATIHAMPLSHSLTYFRQVLLRQYPSSSMSSFPQPPNIPDNMAKNARNMALFFTFLGAAYMHTQQGDVVMPDPSEVVNEENMEVFKNMMLKVGLAGGFFKAGKTMKEKVAEQAASSNVDEHGGEQIAGGADNISDDHVANERTGFDEPDNLRGEEGPNHIADANDVADAMNNDASSENDTAHEVNVVIQTRRPSQQQRSSSMGSLEDLSHMLHHPSAIASRLYNAFSSSNNIDTANCVKTSTASLDASSGAKTKDGSISDNQTEGSVSKDSSLDEGDTYSLSSRRQHRSKRSHKTLSHLQASIGGSHGEISNENHVSCEEKEAREPEEEKTNQSPQAADEDEKTQQPILSPEAIARAMDHPFSPNPYDHPSYHVSANPLNSKGKTVNPSNKGDPEITPEAASFFSFNMKESQDPSSSMMSHGHSVKPTGCIGAYAHAVKTAAAEVTRLVKEERKANYDALPPDKQHELGIRFIEACTDDTKLHIVKKILQEQKKMDVDRFFIGPDDTETCALHAAAFNGAEKVLQFLCGGIDERDPGEDCGSCDVNVRDANGWTALHFAAGANSVASVRVLSEHGAKLTIEAGNGYTPFHWAERLSNAEVAAELGRLGAANRFVGKWMFGGGGNVRDDRSIPFVSFLASRFFAFSG